MADIYISHRNITGLALVCDEDFNPITEQTEITTSTRNKAFYVNFPQGYIGVYSSSRGPVLFVNNKKYFFNDPIWNVKVLKKEKLNQVSFTGLSSEDLVFEYPAIIVDPVDPWSEEEFDDFYIWLTNKRNSQEFIQMWTDKI